MLDGNSTRTSELDLVLCSGVFWDGGLLGFRAVRVGDLLVTSPKPGVAMTSKPVRIGGTTFHRPGTLLGKTLEPLPSGQGDILVLLTLQ
jgi:hypothetical protein